MVAPGNEQAAADLFGEIIEPLQQMPPDLQQVVMSELAKIQFVPVPGATYMRIVTLREHLAAAETTYVKNWAVQCGLYAYLEKNEIAFHPTTEELRLCFLLSEVLPKAFAADPARQILRPGPASRPSIMGPR